VKTLLRELPIENILNSQQDISTDGSPKKDKKKKRGLRTPSFLKKKSKEKKKVEA
jgi:hypothetical protein